MLDAVQTLKAEWSRKLYVGMPALRMTQACRLTAYDAMLS